VDPLLRGGAATGRSRDDPSMVSDGVGNVDTTCCGSVSRGGGHAAARDERPAVATASESPRPTLMALPGGPFRMGSTEQRYPADGEGPPRTVPVGTFPIAAHAISNGLVDS
jgi:formylglycine-generating enzyme